MEKSSHRATVIYGHLLGRDLTHGRGSALPCHQTVPPPWLTRIKTAKSHSFVEFSPQFSVLFCFFCKDTNSSASHVPSYGWNSQALIGQPWAISGRSWRLFKGMRARRIPRNKQHVILAPNLTWYTLYFQTVGKQMHALRHKCVIFMGCAAAPAVAKPA